ncbi:hypothetical protein R69608_03233 [Paraburkholderia nemoris]|nr:hypothetical protein R69608_03233 [Paraburkholderia nemoris]
MPQARALVPTAQVSRLRNRTGVLRSKPITSHTYQDDYEFALFDRQDTARNRQLAKRAACLRMNVSTVIGGVPVRSSTTVLVPAKTPS